MPGNTPTRLRNTFVLTNEVLVPIERMYSLTHRNAREARQEGAEASLPQLALCAV